MDENRFAELWNKAVEDVGDATYPTIVARFAALVAADEREACARLCHTMFLAGVRMDSGSIRGANPSDCEEAIRKRSNVELSGASPLAGAASARTQG